ncbi:MAG: glycine zipper domain-containing protein [Dongiaceae bacterium]
MSRRISLRPINLRRKLIAGLSLIVAMAVALPAPVQADPPPWAPAWGYRAKHGKKDKSKKQGSETVVEQQVFQVPYGIDLGRCNRTEIGAAIGAATGAVVGSQVADKDDQAVGIIGGLIVGGVIGGLIGKAMDNADEACMGHALEYAADGAPVHWRDPNGYDYNVVPQETYQAGGRYCRKYTTTIVINGAPESLAGTACRRPDGNWDIVG